MRTVDIAEYEEATESNLGWCTSCKEFTRDCTEPDAEKYDCPACEAYTVFGAEQGLLMGLFHLED